MSPVGIEINVHVSVCVCPERCAWEPVFYTLLLIRVFPSFIVAYTYYKNINIHKMYFARIQTYDIAA